MRATSRVLRYAASGLLGLAAVLMGLFAAGYAYADLPLWLAVSLTVGWLALAGGLGWLAWRRPDAAVPVLLGLTVVLAGVTVTDARVDLFGRDRAGPVMTVVVVAFLVPLAALALHRATAAALLLLVLGTYQGLAAGIVRGGEAPLGALLTSSSGVVVVPVLVGALLLLLAGWLAHEPPGRLLPTVRARTPH